MFFSLFLSHDLHANATLPKRLKSLGFTYQRKTDENDKKNYFIFFTTFLRILC